MQEAVIPVAVAAALLGGAVLARRAKDRDPSEGAAGRRHRRSPGRHRAVAV
ncbi:hypothetical protein GCM10014719_48350 [Planomonospora parontospora subsp. antibiotica]|nr:hypothetical protein GCM10014719_48350 [Planomonospora parontospora subsp. antibiotica]GII17964.1 hypothetical protein Ppa05_46900 [Planomonospora parontospora subsp. antibiotica]